MGTKPFNIVCGQTRTWSTAPNDRRNEKQDRHEQYNRNTARAWLVAIDGTQKIGPETGQKNRFTNKNIALGQVPRFPVIRQRAEDPVLESGTMGRGENLENLGALGRE